MEKRKTMAHSWILCTKHNDRNSCLAFWRVWELLEPTALLWEPQRLNNSQQYYLKILKIFKLPDYLWIGQQHISGTILPAWVVSLLKGKKITGVQKVFPTSILISCFYSKSQNWTFSTLEEVCWMNMQGLEDKTDL